MTEPTITCPQCKTEIKLTESLAAPLLASTRQLFEKQLAQKDSDIAQRENAMREKEKALTDARRDLDAQVADQVAGQLKTERARVVAQALIEQARGRTLPVARLRFSYESYGTKVSTLEVLRGRSGWLALSVLSIEALGTAEDYLLLAATTDSGDTLHEEDPEKLLRLPAELLPARVHALHESGPPEAALKQQESQRIREVNQRNLGYFEAEVEKLDAWADDLKSGLENDVQKPDREIKEVGRAAAVSATLEVKLQWQKRQRELEEKRGQLRRKIFDRQDDIDAQRHRLIEDLESKLTRRTQTTSLFSIQWSLD